MPEITEVVESVLAPEPKPVEKKGFKGLVYQTIVAVAIGGASVATDNAIDEAKVQADKDEARIVFVTPDSTMEITAKDTGNGIERDTVVKPSGPMFAKLNDIPAATGTTTYTITVRMTDESTGLDSVVLIEAVTPPIGCTPAIKRDYQQVGDIGSVCNRIGPDLAAGQGYYPVTDTIKIGKNISVKTRWTKDKNATPNVEVINEKVGE